MRGRAPAARPPAKVTPRGGEAGAGSRRRPAACTGRPVTSAAATGHRGRRRGRRGASSPASAAAHTPPSWGGTARSRRRRRPGPARGRPASRPSPGQRRLVLPAPEGGRQGRSAVSPSAICLVVAQTLPPPAGPDAAAGGCPGRGGWACWSGAVQARVQFGAGPRWLSLTCPGERARREIWSPPGSPVLPCPAAEYGTPDPASASQAALQPSPPARSPAAMRNMAPS